MSQASMPARELQSHVMAAHSTRIELSSGLEIVGHLKNVIALGDTPIYLQFDSAVHLDWRGQALDGQGIDRHPGGFSSPVGRLKNLPKALEQSTNEDLRSIGVIPGARAALQFQSGVLVNGKVRSFTRAPQGALLLITFTDCAVNLGSELLFDPDWGEFDMAVGAAVTRAGADS